MLFYLLSRSQFIENYATIYDRRYSGQRVSPNENDTEDGSKNVTAVIFIHLVCAQKKSFVPDTSDESLQSTRSIAIDLRPRWLCSHSCYSRFFFILFAHHISHYYNAHKWARIRRRRKSKLFGEPMRLLKFIELAFITWKSVMQIFRFVQKRAVADSSLSHFLPRCANTFSNRTARVSTNYKHLPRRQGRFHSSTHSHERPMLYAGVFFFFSHRREQPID